MARQVAIIGDHFMLPEVFETKLIEACGPQIATRTRKDNWPDEPMEHGYAVAGMDGLVITSYSIHYTKLYDNQDLRSAVKNLEQAQAERNNFV